MKTDLSGIALCHNRLSIDADTAALVDEPTLEQSQSVEDSMALARLVAERFAAPLDFSPVLQSVVKGDTIAIAVAHNTKKGMEIAGVVADLLIADGHFPEKITIVFASSAEANESESSQCKIQVFDPYDEQQKAWLFAGVDDQSICVCRTLFEADVVIPVGSFFGATPRDSICPTFCTSETRDHLSHLREIEADATINMINEQLGIFWQVNILVGPGDWIIDICVGMRRAVLHFGIKRLEALWSVELKAQPLLVVATIESDAEQTWEQALAALKVADRVVAEEGAIVLVSHIKSPPPQSNRKNALTRLLGRRHVYLFSELASTEVESSGFAPLTDSGELSRLIRQYGSATLLRDANKLDARVAHNNA